jgi:hypothetical protein
MSVNGHEVISRKSRNSGYDYDNSSICNKSVKSGFDNLSVDLPHRKKKYTHI